jgi:hypothetical protein
MKVADSHMTNSRSCRMVSCSQSAATHYNCLCAGESTILSGSRSCRRPQIASNPVFIWPPVSLRSAPKSDDFPNFQRKRLTGSWPAVKVGIVQNWAEFWLDS